MMYRLSADNRYRQLSENLLIIGIGRLSIYTIGIRQLSDDYHPIIIGIFADNRYRSIVNLHNRYQTIIS